MGRFSSDKLSDLSTKELQDYSEFCLNRIAEKSVLTAPFNAVCAPTCFSNDSWSLYAYGDIFRIVFIKKRGIKAKKDNAVKLQKDISSEADDKRFLQSISRSKSTVFEIAMCNEFQHFCTFTQDEKLRDRFDLSDFRKDFAMFVRNLNRGREVKIKYLLIPEQHKDGAWHMHGLLSGLSESDLRLFSLNEKLPDKIRKRLKNGENIYDWTAYRRRFGYFTCTEIKSHTACSKYITKYISKDFQKTVRAAGEHLFFASQGLKRREVIVKNEYGRCPFTDTWDFENEYVKIKEITVPKTGQ